jgi:hypothetical protein
MEMTNCIRNLSKEFDLSRRQQNFVKVLCESDYKLEESFYREKLKFLGPNFTNNFQQNIKTLMDKDILLRYCDDKGRNIITMNPSIQKKIENGELEETEKIIAPVVMEVKIPRKSTINRKEKVINLICETLAKAPEKTLERNILYDEIIKKMHVSPIKFKHFLTEMHKTEIIKMFFSGWRTSRRTNIKLLSKELQMPKDNKALEVVSPKESLHSIQFEFNSNEYEICKEILNTLGIQDSPKAWLLNLLQDSVINLLDKKIADPSLAMSSEVWEKYRFIEKEMKKENKVFNKELNEAIANFIGEKFNDSKKTLLSRVQNAVSALNDSKSVEIIEAVEKLLNDNSFVKTIQA